MQVTHQNDHVTHAVVGGMPAEELKISQTAEFFQILSSTLYSDKQLAVIREVLCNAWDAHIEAGCTDTPVEVLLTEDKLIIKDRGKGIDRSMIVPIYGTYGGSTKANNKAVTGGFGLGCKAPFAYIDHFEVTSCHEGTKTIYRMALSAAQVGGKPSIMPIVDIPTTETGITVTIDVKSSGDYARFLALVRQIAAFGEMKVKLNGNLVPTIPFSSASANFVLIQQDKMPNPSIPIYVRCGNVIYPLARNDDYDVLYDEAVQKIRSISGSNNYHYTRQRLVQWSLVLLAEPDTVSFTPSRESLSLTERTVNAVSALLSGFTDFAGKAIENEMLHLLKLEYQASVKNETFHNDVIASMPYHPKDAFYRKIIDKKFLGNRTDLALAQLSHRLPSTPSFFRKELILRIEALIQTGKYDKGLLQSLRSEAQSLPSSTHQTMASASSWFQSKIAWPLLKKLQERNIDKKWVYAYHSSSFTARMSDVFIPITSYRPKSFYENLSFVPKIAIVGHSRKSMDERLPAYKDYTETVGQRSLRHIIACVLPRKQDVVTDTIDVLTKLGYKVIDLTKVQSWEAPEFHAKAAKAYKPTPRKKGIPKLSAFETKNGTIDFDVLFSDIEDEDRLLKPECYVQVSRKANDRISRFGFNTTAGIYTYFGDRIGVVYSQPAAIKCAEQKIPHIDLWFYKQLNLAFKNDPAVKGAYLSNDDHRSLPYYQKSKLRFAREDEKLAKHFKLSMHDPDTKAAFLVRAFMDISAYIIESNKDLKEIRDIIKSWGECKRTIAVAKQLDDSKLISILNVDTTLSLLKSKDTPDALKTQIRDLIITATKG